MNTGIPAKSSRHAVTLLICSMCAIPTSWPQSPQERHSVVGRVQIPDLTSPPKLAEPTQISLQSTGPKITSVLANWSYYNVSGLAERSFDDDEILPVSYDSSGGAYVSVNPRRLGKVQLMLSISFADGGIERKMIDLQVDHSVRQPEKLVVTRGVGDNRRNSPVVYLDLSEAHRTIRVAAAAIYKNVTSPIPLNPSDVSFKLISAPGGAAEIDPSTGIVTARNVGQALLETSFGGVSTLTCIDVMKNVGGGRRSRCNELLPPGRSLPPSLMDLDSTPPPAVKPRAR